MAVESSRVRGLLSTLARSIPSHSVLSVADACHEDLIQGREEVCGSRKGRHLAVAALMTVVSENVGKLDKAQVSWTRRT